jgi:hypothetical protein
MQELTMSKHHKHTLAAGLLSAALAGCALFVPPDIRPGQTEAEVRGMLGQATNRYAMPGAATRLEFATGPYGRSTWMVDLDPTGRVTGARQVLNEASFADFQRRAPGMGRDELLRTLGRPGERRHGGRAGGEVWSWRYPTNDCLWFQSSIGDDGLVRDGAYAIDPRCDAPADRE